ncbi:O-methyltransferase-domain-containing protein [Pestalotiopsis sp. NC0098]|nr:O-methyltransferase-domain-containing protein [Pestalotiopsis sp. NC0098]
MSRIVELSASIADNTAKVDAYLTANDLPTPSFDVNAPLQSMIPNTEVEVEAARVAIIDDTLELRRLMLGPRDYLMTFTSNELLSQHAIVHFRLDHSFPIGTEASFAEIAEYSGLLEDDVCQIIRRAALQGIFHEPRPGMVAHTVPSRLLAKDPIFREWVAWNVEDLWPATSQTVPAMVKYLKSEEPNETGFALYNNTDKPIYEFFSGRPEKAHRFANVMKALSNRRDLAIVHAVNGFNWGQLGSGTIVDVGGSEGQTAIAISRTFPELSIIVQDLAPVVEAGKKDLPEELTGRVTFMTHNFLTPQPVQNAGVYLFRWILHNWSDKYCVRILRNLIPALKEGARIVVVDNVAPEPRSISNWAETRMRNMDFDPESHAKLA